MSSGASSMHLPALSEAEFGVLGEHVFCDDEVVIDWREIEAMPDEAELTRRDYRNEKILRALALVEEHDETRSDNAERAELHRLEGKLDLVLEFLTALVHNQQDRGPASNARFNTRGLCWDATGSFAAGALLDVDCFLLAQWPLPIRVCARVVAAVELRDRVRVCTRIEGLGSISRDWLGKLVFRRHRRTVALQRARG